MKRLFLKPKKPVKPEKVETIAEAPLTHSILTDKLVKDFCDLIVEGLPGDACCDYLGIMPSTYWIWMAKGKRYLDGGCEPKELMAYGVFVRCFRKATADYRRTINSGLHDPGNDKWFRDLTILERRDRRTWGREEPAGGGEDQFDPDEKFL